MSNNPFMQRWRHKRVIFKTLTTNLHISKTQQRVFQGNASYKTSSFLQLLTRKCPLTCCFQFKESTISISNLEFNRENFILDKQNTWLWSCVYSSRRENFVCKCRLHCLYQWLFLIMSFLSQKKTLSLLNCQCLKVAIFMDLDKLQSHCTQSRAHSSWSLCFFLLQQINFVKLKI